MENGDSFRGFTKKVKSTRRVDRDSCRIMNSMMKLYDLLPSDKKSYRCVLATVVSAPTYRGIREDSTFKVQFSILLIPSGLLSCNSAGSAASGKLCQAMARQKRKIAIVPTEVLRPSEVAGNGPP